MFITQMIYLPIDKINGEMVIVSDTQVSVTGKGEVRMVSVNEAVKHLDPTPNQGE